jgi:fumarate hydratase subunit beta
VHEEGDALKELRTPLSTEDVVSLRAGDKILLSGTVFSARDKAHRFLLEEDLKRMKGAVVYHCGPVIKEGRVVAAGPTTSSRMNAFTPALIDKYSVKAVIGKGGMDDKVLEALRGRAVYLSAIGGAAVTYARSLRVIGVHKEEFGMPEAIWEFEATDLPLVVTMDAHGSSLHGKVLESSRAADEKLLY